MQPPSAQVDIILLFVSKNKEQCIGVYKNLEV